MLFVISEDWALATHRLHLVKAALEMGHDVAVVTRVNTLRYEFEALGIKVFDWRLERRSVGLLRELSSLWALRRVLFEFKPDLIHAVALKPVIYAGLVTRFGYRGSLVSALGGAGYIFSACSMRAKLLQYPVKLLMRFALAGSQRVLILQNPDDVELFVSNRVLPISKVKLVRGAGVETDMFTPCPEPAGDPLVILPARLLWDKGVGEFVNVARRIRQKKPSVRFIVVGDPDPHNPASIPESQIEEWVQSGAIENWRRVNHRQMPKIYRAASIVCLPSYREGLPKVLLEAASMARPLLAFDVSGCREIVRTGINGYLVPFGDEAALEKVLLELIDNDTLRLQLGLRGRQIVEDEFSSEIINAKTFSIWNTVMDEVHETST